MHQNYQKIMEKEILNVNQTLQNLADQYEIDFTKYNNLEKTYWFTDHLYLVLREEKQPLPYSAKPIVSTIDIYATWDCKTTAKWTCYIVMEKNWKKIPLTKKNLVNVKQLKFKITPFKDPYSISFEAYKRRQPYFTMFMDIRIKNYNPANWRDNVAYQIQEGFDLNYYWK